MNYEEHLKNLRTLYYESYPEQRLHVAKQRIENSAHGPNQIIAYVSAIEGMLRSLVIWGETITGKPSKKTYEKYEHCSINELFAKYLEQRGTESKDVVTDSTYTLVRYAVKYRNLLAHECTYLGQDRYPDLIDACETFLQRLANHASIIER